MTCNSNWKRTVSSMEKMSNPIILIGQRIDVNRSEYTPLYYIPWVFFVFNKTNASLFFESVVYNVGYDIRIMNVTTGIELATMSVQSSGFHELNFTAPRVNSRLLIQVRRNGVGTNPRMYGLGFILK